MLLLLQCARRENWSDLLIGIQVFGFYIAAAVLPSAEPSATWWSSATLLLCGNVYWLALVTLRPILVLVMQRLCPASSTVPVERAKVCPHKVFMYHRNNEFMFLMLGEVRRPRQALPASHTTYSPHRIRWPTCCSS